MEITVSKRFLRVPVKFDGTSHKFTFSENGTPVYKFDAVYTEENADATGKTPPRRSRSKKSQKRT